MNNTIKMLDLPINERPIEKLLSLGVDSLSNAELLAVILRCGIPGENALTLSQRILSEVNGLDGILDLSYSDISSIKGIKKVKGSQILALGELFRRINTLKSCKEQIIISSPKDISSLLINEMSNLNQEVLKLIVLNTKNAILKTKDIFKGSLNSSIVHPREIYQEAIRASGASIIICHNHPSGDPTPSKEDINITLRIKECGKIIGIELIDHIIIGNTNYISLKEKGII